MVEFNRSNLLSFKKQFESGNLIQSLQCTALYERKQVNVQVQLQISSDAGTKTKQPHLFIII
jgi:hypothetical protein